MFGTEKCQTLFTFKQGKFKNFTIETSIDLKKANYLINLKNSEANQFKKKAKFVFLA